jgi:hypothetical protein
VLLRLYLFLKIQFLEDKKEKNYLRNIHPNMSIVILHDKKQPKMVPLKNIQRQRNFMLGIFGKKVIIMKQ